MLDFVSGIPTLERTDDAVSDDLARRFGLTGSWTATSGITGLAEAADTFDVVWRSRLCPVDIEGSIEIPAVAGATAWPGDAAPLRVLRQPNVVGTLERADGGPVAALIEPFLAGPIRLPATTIAVTVLLGQETITLVPGEPNVISGVAAALARLASDELTASAAAAAQRAQRLAKYVTQIRGVRSLPLKPSTGRFVITTPFSPHDVLAAMADRDVAGGVALALAEYPGGISVVCTADHSVDDLRHYTSVLASLNET